MNETTDKKMPDYKPLNQGEVDKAIFEYLQKLSPQQKFMIAKGLGGLKPAQILIFSYILIGDSDERISQTAFNTFSQLPPRIVEPLFGGAVPAKVLDFATKLWIKNPDYEPVLARIALNRNTTEYTLEYMIMNAPDSVLDIIANNQQRLQQSPGLIYAFGENPNISVATVSKVLEFARRQHLITPQEENKIIDRIANAKMKAKGEPEESEEGILPKDESGEPIFPPSMVEETMDESVRDVIEKRQEEEKKEEERRAEEARKKVEEEIEKKLDIREKIRRMSVSEKLRLAVRGNMEVRGILIFDKVSMVAKAVIKSPRVTKLEIERWSAIKTMDEEILIEISKNKEFMKSYQIRYNLVVNPRTPLSIAIRLLGTLMEKDIKNIAKSKAVPQAIANIARQRLDVAKRRREGKKE